MDLDVRELLADTIKRYLDRYCEENGFDPVWGDPIVGFADAKSPMFRELKTVVHPDHLLPEDILHLRQHRFHRVGVRIRPHHQHHRRPG